MTRALHTDQERVSVPVVSDKVLAVSTCSMLFSIPFRRLTFARLWKNKGSRKLGFSGGYNVPLKSNPFNFWGKVIDCGDIPVTS